MPFGARVCKILSALLLAGLLTSGLARGQQPAKSASTKQPVIAANNGYVGTAACSRCHLGIANQFAHASMGHSLTRITPDFLKTLPVSATYYDAKSNRHFEVHTENGKIYQSEFETAGAGPDAS